jgi:WhiB family redox-sensing transcriptional regulator
MTTAHQPPAPGECGRIRPPATIAGAEQRDWRMGAACAGVDPELFFALTEREVGAAKLICRECRVLADCREWADQHDITYGVWGAESEEERRARLVGAPSTTSASLAMCEHCNRAYLRRRRGQQFCSHRCHHASMAKVRGRDCGTTAAARRHRKRGEPMDDACRMAEALYRAQLRAGRRRRRPAGPTANRGPA